MTQDQQLSLFSINPSEEVRSGEFFDVKRSWSASKHRIILKYLQAFSYILARHNSRVNYVDAFAGKGSYDEGIGLENVLEDSSFWSNRDAQFKDTDGSPLISLKISRILKEEKYIIKCLFAEEKKDRNQELRRRCQEFDQSLYKIYDPLPFESCFSQVKADLEGYPTLFFLDSFGLKGLKFSTIKEVAEYIDSYKGELFFLFHNRAIARNAGQSLSNQNYAKAYCKHLTEFLGCESEDVWKAQWLQLKDTPQFFEKWALEYFKKQLTQVAGFRGVSSFPIHEVYYDSRPQYHIVFCSNYPEKAFGILLNDLLYTEEELLYHQESNTGNRRFLEQQWSEESMRRHHDIKLFIEQNKSKLFAQPETLADHITQIILAFGSLGFLKRSQYREILVEMIDGGDLHVTNLGKSGKPTLKSMVSLHRQSS